MLPHVMQEEGEIKDYFSNLKSQRCWRPAPKPLVTTLSELFCLNLQRAKIIKMEEKIAYESSSYVVI